MKSIFIYLLLLLSCNTSYGQDKVIYDIKVQGHERTKQDYILKLLKSKNGAILDSITLEEDITRLKRLPTIAHAYYQVFYSHDNLYNVFVNIEENFTLIPYANVYTTNNEEFAFRLGLTEYNFLGRGIEVGGFYQYDNFSSYSVNVKAPNLINNKIGLALNKQLLSTLEPVFFDGGETEYQYTNNSYELIGIYDFNGNNRLNLGFNYFKESYDYVSGYISDEVPSSFEVDKTLFKSVYEHNKVKYEFEKLEGIKNTLYAQYITAYQNTLPDFAIVWNDFQYYKIIGDDGNWANRLRVGLSSNDETPFAPFAVDNNLNIRGVGNIIDRGTGVIVANTEYRHNLLAKENIILQSNVFIDAGSWRNPGGSFNDFTNPDNFRVYPGVGARLIHKKIYGATLRLDYGYGVTQNATNGFVIGLGQYF